MSDNPKKEQRIMRMMRKTLAQIVKDTTPAHSGMRSSLKESTIQSIRDCFGLIAARERELMEMCSETTEERPRYADEASDTVVIPLEKIKRNSHDK